MADYANPLRPHERLGDRDRQEAITRLASARDEGRITAQEFEQRSEAARSAVTWSDLVPLFDDLPRPQAAAAPTEDWSRHSRALGGAWGATVMAFMPFIALGLFFISGFVWDGWAWGWLFFLLIPIAGIIIYGPGSEDRRRRW
ncbi:DUF1707 SHOCT-like domain-containing protein [Humibacter ginsenosidimutans]|uniref:DUF1707 domain-containing protein n=1 Tax=Humibacter ginsenosidimutans TaxID=2599293 RepID=A0A5B8M401_9MICO|nr:DUF1707 domain-containing protein [Humibacter ginsenosidimutans]QDZ14901.1 DUF1707 domain-containing protein [Humibacter ginsenosidimutans]